jgi:hypothetical protein
MTAPLVRPIVLSIYMVNNQRVLLPERMSRATPDMKRAIYGIRGDVKKAGGQLALSDLFRSYDMQFQAHLDWASKKKKAYSPPPGGSMHEAGRAFDVDLAALGMPLAEFWKVAKKWGVVPIIAKPDPKTSECWHFECRGSHQRVYDYYKSGKGTNFARPAQAMAASAILSYGLPHDRFKGRESAAFLQSGLIRLGLQIGNIDGDLGPKSNAALTKAGVTAFTRAEQVSQMDGLLQQKFPDEYFDKVPEEGEAEVLVA